MLHAPFDGSKDHGLLNWRTGTVAGVVGAVFYSAFVEAVNVAENGVGAFFIPFRQIGAVVLGPRALQGDFSLIIAAGTGMVVHVVVAAVFGIALAWLLARASLSFVGSTLFGLAMGLAFYALDVLLIFPEAFPWFLSNGRMTQSFGHAVFGAVTGAWLSARHPGLRPLK